MARSPRRLPWLAALLSCAAAAAPAEAPVYASPEEVRPLAAGASVPSVRVRTVEGEELDLAALVRDAGALLVFYRGGW